MSDPPALRFYGDLAPWWPLISPPEEYEEEASFAATLLRSASIPVREVLELGSGGGHNAVHLKAQFALTLVDLSEGMLGVSRQLNPECEHHAGDMRSVRLGRTFDAVFVADTWTTTEYVFLLRDVGGTVETVHDTHRLGLFERDRWLRVLSDAGFDAEAVPEVTSEDRPPRTCFVARRRRSV